MINVTARVGHRGGGSFAEMKISACIIAFNEERNLERCLKSVAPLWTKVLLVDSGSADRTPEIAAQFGARVVQQDWLGYVGQKNFALAQAQHSWVLSIDADEEISPELGGGHRAGQGRRRGQCARRAERLPVFAHRLLSQEMIRHGDWYPDRLVRLFRRTEARFTGGRVHEKLEVRGEHPILPGHLHHFIL